MGEKISEIFQMNINVLKCLHNWNQFKCKNNLKNANAMAESSKDKYVRTH